MICLFIVAVQMLLAAPAIHSIAVWVFVVASGSDVAKQTDLAGTRLDESSSKPPDAAVPLPRPGSWRDTLAYDVGREEIDAVPVFLRRATTDDERSLSFDGSLDGFSFPFDLNEEPVLSGAQIGEVSSSIHPEKIVTSGNPRHRGGRREKGTATVENPNDSISMNIQDTREFTIEAELSSESRKEEEGESSGRHDDSASFRSDAKMKPFYLRGLPPTRVSKLFENYEVRYWDAMQSGRFVRSGNRRKFFTTNKDQGLTDEERRQFRKLAKQFTDKLADRSERKMRANAAYQRSRYGLGKEKTDEQKEATRRKTQRNYLIRRLRKINADLENNVVEVQWTDNHSKTLQGLVAKAPLQPGDTLLELYQRWLHLTGASSCIELPEDM